MSETHISRNIVHSIHYSCPVIFRVCTGIALSLTSSEKKMLNDWENARYVMSKQGSAKFAFRVGFGRISCIATLVTIVVFLYTSYPVGIFILKRKAKKLSALGLTHTFLDPYIYRTFS